MPDPREVLCLACGSLMRPQIDKLDMSRAGDGPSWRNEGFAGILADVYGCTCGRVAIRPVAIELSRSRADSASPAAWQE